MTEETLKRIDSLRERLYDVRKRLDLMKSWGDTLYREKAYENELPTKYVLTISEDWGGGRCVLQREISREEVEMEYNAELLRLEREKQNIEKEIAEL